MAGAEEPVLTELRPDELQPDRQPLGEATRNRETRQPGEVRRDREHVARVHGERVRGLVAYGEGDRRRGRGRDHVNARERLAVLADEERSHLLRLPVERVVVPGRERVRADHDAPLRLGPEALVPRALHHLAVGRALGARPVADTVVAREIRGRLSRRDEVVARHPVPVRER